MYNLINIMNAYKLNHDGDIFDSISLYEKIDKDFTINTILDEAGTLEPVTSNPDLLKLKINNFFGRNYVNFQHLMDAFLLEYEPIENYDRNSEITITDTGTIIDDGTHDNTRTPDLKNVETSGTKSTRTLDTTNKETIDATNTRTADLTNTKTGTDSDNETKDLTQNQNTSTENLVYAFNDSTVYSPKDKQRTDGTTTETGTDNHTLTYDTTAKETGTDTNTQKGTNTETQTGTDTTENSGTNTTTATGTEKNEGTEKNTQTTDMEHKTIDHTHGNIGVTTSQQMLQSEIDLWTKFNVYKCIADMFINDLMITVID